MRTRDQRRVRRALTTAATLALVVVALVLLVARSPWDREARLARLDLAGLKREARAHPTDPLPFHLLGRRLSAAGEPDKAFVMVSRAYELNDREPRYVAQMVGALVDTGQAAAARSLADFASTRWPDSAEVRAQLSRAHAAQGGFTDALREAETAARLDPESAVSLRALGNALSLNKRPDAAFDAFGKAVAREPNDAELLSEYGEARAKYGHAAVAETLFRRALALAPKAARPLGRLGELLADRSLTAEAREEARALLTRSLAARPEAAEVEYVLGRLELRNGKATEAIRHLESALSHDARFGEAYQALGRAYELLGQFDRSREAFARWRRFSDERRELAHLQLRLRRSPDDGRLKRRWNELSERRKP